MTDPPKNGESRGTPTPAPHKGSDSHTITSVEHTPALIDPFTVPCGYCNAVAGQQCISGITGRPLRRALAHPRRICAAEAVQHD